MVSRRSSALSLSRSESSALRISVLMSGILARPNPGPRAAMRAASLLDASQKQEYFDVGTDVP
jgi:hypothetical protein